VVGNTGNCSANFTYNVSGNTVSFANNSNTLGAVGTYLWDFGDNNISTLFNPIHSYTTAGTYTVCLTVTTANNCTDTYCQTIVITSTPQCEANFNFAVNGNTVTFFSASTPVNSTTQHFWIFGDGDSAMGTLLTHTYAVAGSYNVCLAITTANGCH